MTIPTIYRWDDTDAPVLSGEAGSMVNLLTKCLVDGYGDKLPASWSLDFINAELTKASFRNDSVGGTGFFLSVDEVAPAANFVDFQGYEVMTDVDTGIGPFSAAVKLCKKSSTVSATSRPWLIIATEKFFYLSVWESVTGDESVVLPPNVHNFVFSFGDFIPVNVEGFNCVMGYGTGGVSSGYYAPNSTPPVNTTNFLVGSNSFTCPRDVEGSVDSQTDMWFGALGGPINMTYYMWTILRRHYGLPYTPDNLVLTRPHIGDGGTYGWRGQLPGLHYPCHDATNFENLQQITQDGRTFLFLQLGYLYGGHPGDVCLAIEIGVDWDA